MTEAESMRRVYACRDCGRRPYRHGKHWGGPCSMMLAGDERAHAGRCQACEEDIARVRDRLLGVLTRRRVQVATL